MVTHSFLLQVAFPRCKWICCKFLYTSRMIRKMRQISWKTLKLMKEVRKLSKWSHWSWFRTRTKINQRVLPITILKINFQPLRIRFFTFSWQKNLLTNRGWQIGECTMSNFRLLYLYFKFYISSLYYWNQIYIFRTK